MRTPSSLRFLLLTIVFLLSTSCVPHNQHGAPAVAAPTIRPSPIAYQHIVRRDPNFSIHVVTIDLTDPRVKVAVAAAGEDPDGDGPWLTTLLPTSEIAEREQFDVAVNGDFFLAKSTRDIEGKNTGYVRGKPSKPVGPAVTHGREWARTTTTRPAFAIAERNAPSIITLPTSAPAPVSVLELIGGNPILLQGGQKLADTSLFATARHPRTAVGFNAARTRLVLLVVDGRQPNLSIGMTLSELADEMRSAGCNEALNLDGGGSTTLVLRNPATGQERIINSPSDTHERSVVDILGIKVSGE